MSFLRLRGRFAAYGSAAPTQRTDDLQDQIDEAKALGINCRVRAGTYVLDTTVDVGVVTNFKIYAANDVTIKPSDDLLLSGLPLIKFGHLGTSDGLPNATYTGIAGATTKALASAITNRDVASLTVASSLACTAGVHILLSASTVKTATQASTGIGGELVTLPSSGTGTSISITPFTRVAGFGGSGLSQNYPDGGTLVILPSGILSTGLEFEGIIFDGDDGNGTTFMGYLLRGGIVDGLTFDRCTFKHFNHQDVLPSMCRNVIYDDCDSEDAQITGGGSGYSFYTQRCSHVTVQNSRCSATRRIIPCHYGGSEILYSGITATDMISGSRSLDIGHGAGAQYVKVVNVTCSEGIDVGNSNFRAGPKHVRITDCTVSGNCEIGTFADDVVFTRVTGIQGLKLWGYAASASFTPAGDGYPSNVSFVDTPIGYIYQGGDRLAIGGDWSFSGCDFDNTSNSSVPVCEIESAETFSMTFTDGTVDNRGSDKTFHFTYGAADTAVEMALAITEHAGAPNAVHLEVTGAGAGTFDSTGSTWSGTLLNFLDDDSAGAILTTGEPSPP